MQGIVDDARHGNAAAHQAHGDGEDREAVGEVGRAVDGVHDPLILTARGVMAALFGQNGVLGELLLEGRDDHVFRTLVEFRDKINRTFLSDLAWRSQTPP